MGAVPSYLSRGNPELCPPRSRFCLDVSCRWPRSETVWNQSVIDGIIDAAADASAIAFQPRAESRLNKFLRGDYSIRLVTNADGPVISLPTDEE